VSDAPRCHGQVKRPVEIRASRVDGLRLKDEDRFVYRQERCDTALTPVPHPERPMYWCKREHGGCGRMWTLVAIEAANPEATLP
jgi:hypothetical protein